MSGYRVEITPIAEAHLAEAHAWWQENRPLAPEAIREEIARASALLAQQPHVGSRASSSKVAEVRRIFLARVRYHVYYRIRESESLVEVLAFWHASRGTTPPSVET